MSQLPTTRALRRPYFLCRTPNGLDNYVNHEFRLIITSRHEPLGTILAPLITKDEGKSGKLEYDLSALEAANPEKLTYLPESLRAELSAAVEHFLAPVKTGAQKMSDHEKRLRAAFKLPDPDLESDAYWLYGPVDDRRLMIIWGCEFRQNSSLPLSDPDPNRPGVLEKLSAKAPTWRQTQDAAVRLVREKQLPLAAFLATAATGASGEIESYLLKGKKIPAKECQPVSGKIPSAFVDALQAAAQAQLELALPDSEYSEYAKSLIKSLALPDPEQLQQRYLKTKSGIFVVLDGLEEEAQCLLPTGDMRLNVPASTKAADGTVLMTETVVEKLRKIAKKPSRLPYYAATAAALCAIAGLGAFILSDTNPPQLKEVVTSQDPSSVVLLFNERLAEESLSDWQNAFTLQSDRGHFLPVTAAVFEPGSRNKAVRLSLATPLNEAYYTAIVRGVSDLRGNTAEEVMDKRFEFRDTTLFALLRISAHPTEAARLILDFNKPVLERSVRPGNFQITGFRVLEAALAPGNTRVILTTEQRFEHGLAYSLRVEDLRDATANENPISESLHRFEFRDIIPPEVIRVAAEQNQITVQVAFSKAVDPVSAENPANYSIFYLNATGGESQVPIRTLQLLADQQAVNLYTAQPLTHGVAYQLRISNIADTANPPNILPQRDPLPFTFRGVLDQTPPAIAQVRTVRGENDRILISFNKPVTTASALRTQHFTVETADVEVTAVHATSSPTEFVIEVSPRLPTSAAHRISVTGVEDFLGNRLREPIQSRPFAAEGPTEPMSNNLQDLITSAETRQNGTQVVIHFQQIADDWTIIPARAADPRNYRFSVPVEIASIVLEPEHAPVRITLQLSPQTPLPRGRHSITLRNMRLQDTPNSVEAPASVSFNN